MKNITIFSGILICLMLVQCKKDSSQLSVPRSGLELLASPSAQQYMVAVAASDTFVMQDIDGNMATTTLVQERVASHWLQRAQTHDDKWNNSFGLLFYRLDTYDYNNPIPVNCPLISDIVSQDSLKIGDISHYHYGMQVFYDNPAHQTDSYEWYATHTYYGLMNIVERTAISKDTSGCTTYRVRGTLSCAVTDPPHTCGVYPIAISFSLNVTQ